MADESDFEIPISVDATDAVEGFKQIGDEAEGMGEKVKDAGEEGESALKEMAEQVNEGLEKIQELSEGLGGLANLVGLAAVGEVIHKITETLAEGSQELQMFASRTQMSLAEANEFTASMEALGIPTQAVSMAMRKLSGDIATGGKHLAELGIETKNASGESKTLAEVYDEVADKLAGYGNNAKEAADANMMLGRSGQVLVQTHQIQKEMMEQLSTVTKATGLSVDSLTESGNTQRYMEVLLNEQWRAFATAVAPAVVTGFKTVLTATMLMSQGFNTVVTISKICGDALIELGKIAVNAFQGIVSGAMATANAIKDAFTGNLVGLAKDAVDAKAAIDQIGKAAQAPFDEFRKKANETLTEWVARTKASSEVIENTWNGTFERIAREQAKAMGAGASGAGAPDLAGAKKAGKDIGEALAAGIHEGMLKMDTVSKEITVLQKQASEDTTKAFQDDVGKTMQAYNQLQSYFQQWAAAVTAKNKEAAKEFEQDWRDALTKFNQDFKQSETQFNADLKSMDAAVKSFVHEAGSEFQTLGDAIIRGNVNWTSIYTGMLTKLLNYSISIVERMVTNWLTGMIEQEMASNSGFANILSTMVSFFGSQTAVHKVASKSQDQDNTGTAATGAYSAMASIPYVGPALGAAAAAEAEATCQALSSAAGGFDIPAGMNPITQLHAKEMVLPADLAEGARKTFSGGNQTTNRSTHNWNISAWDSKSVSDMFRSNPGLIAGAVAEQERAGGRMYTG